LGEKNTGPNPTDRAKKGTKRHPVVDANGIPLGLVVAGANRNDCKLLEATLSDLVIARPKTTPRTPQHLCLDKAYDHAFVRDLVAALHFIGHIPRRRTAPRDRVHHPAAKARRWVSERTHSWMNRFRRILIRWEKRADTYLAMLHLTCAIIVWRLLR
jgi:transposase